MTPTQQNARALLAELQRLTELRPVLEAALRGEKIEGRVVSMLWHWVKCSDSESFAGAAYDYRVAPKTILVNGIEVPEPMREAPVHGAVYWMPRFGQTYLAEGNTWDGGEYDRVAIDRGLCHSTREAAEAHARAMMAASAREGAC